MKKIATPTATLLLLSLNCQANTDVPDMQMHIFKHEVPAADNQPALQMVIFSNDQLPQNRNKDQGKNIAISNNQTYYEENQTSQQEMYVEESEEDIRIAFNINAGYRQDELDWTIAAPDGSPNILSELTWDNIEIAVVEVGMSMQTPSNWVFDARFAYGTILDGDNQDSDYFGDNRTQEFSRSNNVTDEGSTIDASVGFGYQINVIPSPAEYVKPVLSLTPKIGASFHSQNFKIQQGYQTIPATGNFGGLDSSYDTTWYGPWAGVDSELSIADRFSIIASFEYHYAFYEATANWNLRTDFAHPESFEHEIEGTGYIASLGSQFRVTEDLFVNLSVDYQKWKADKKGISTIHTADDATLETKLNEVNWESMGANLGLSYNF